MNYSNYFFLLVVVSFDILTYRFALRKLFSDYFMLNKLVAKGNHIEGVIIDIVSEEDVDGYTQYAPVIKYSVNNIEYNYKSDNFSFTKPEVGKKIDLCYSISNPNHAIEDYKSILLIKAFQIVLFTVVLIGLNLAALYKILFQ